MSQIRDKVLFLCTEDWFFHSHFLPLIKAANFDANREVVLVTTTGGKHLEIEKLGVKVIPIDFDRSAVKRFSALGIMFQLIKVLKAEKPDLIHFISLKPILLGGLAALFTSRASKIYHLTGQGFLAVSTQKSSLRLRPILYRIVSWLLGAKKSWLLIENEDDLSLLQNHGLGAFDRYSLLGGAGVDEDEFALLPLPAAATVQLGFVGRMVWSKGVDVLMAAVKSLAKEGIDLHLNLYGEPDADNPKSVSEAQLQQWALADYVSWHGRSNDVSEVWRGTDIAVIPSRGGEGLPRALLEAASCGRPLVVTDVPGNRHFVKDGTEGFIVPADDAAALADALKKLIASSELRAQMGLKARERVLSGFTEAHVVEAVGQVYKGLLKK